MEAQKTSGLSSRNTVLHDFVLVLTLASIEYHLKKQIELEIKNKS